MDVSSDHNTRLKCRTVHASCSRAQSYLFCLFSGVINGFGTATHDLKFSLHKTRRTVLVEIFFWLWLLWRLVIWATFRRRLPSVTSFFRFLLSVGERCLG